MTQANLAADCTAMAFGTPISTRQRGGAGDGLRAAILSRETAARGVLRSNLGGRHSDLDPLCRDDPHMARFKARLTGHASDLTTLVLPETDAARKPGMKVDAWANAPRDGDCNNVHDHPGARWSGIHYVAAATPAPGATPHNPLPELPDPRVGVNMPPLPGSIFEGRCLIAPLPGLTVFFPSWLKHLAHPFRGKGVRISISWSISIQS